MANFVEEKTLQESYRQTFGKWAGKPFYRPTPNSGRKINVGEYGAAVVRIESPNSREDTFRAVLEIPNGGSNRWTAEELIAFAAKLVDAAHEMTIAKNWLATGANPEVEQDGKRKFVAVFENGDCLGFEDVSNLLSFGDDVERYSLFFNEGGRLFPVQVGAIDWGSDRDNPNVAICGTGELLVNGRVVGHYSRNER